MKETFTIDSNHKFLRSNYVATCVVLKHNLGPNMLYLKVFSLKINSNNLCGINIISTNGHRYMHMIIYSCTGQGFQIFTNEKNICIITSVIAPYLQTVSFYKFVGTNVREFISLNLNFRHIRPWLWMYIKKPFLIEKVFAVTCVITCG